MSEHVNVVNNEEKLRFEVSLNGEFAYIEYRYYKKDIAFMHTTVPDPFKGKGIASAMAVAALNFAKNRHYKIMLYCPFVSRYVREHPEYHALVDTDYHPSFGNDAK
ncbi:N-acetyltransferase [Mucilaginibacter sp. BJC16-A38]|uniref:GNAT family N-acetyltransferase n=1 Tax=Mucilaginibacter phenanthrenivorans TaxID=1234842 RepID=UPI002157C0E4|nr:GNAT family N-acetyltransferase [Mucilaginibacter phenanthrenivorans]MCR8556535.1 N-acetyltransferase [Mucilaginibacter phenanthrenivorans]